ncbi:MAG: hypothetical protein U0521_04940 [Anaerolineae bacterium]
MGDLRRAAVRAAGGRRQLHSYEYAFVRDLTGNFTFLNTVIPPLLRGFRGFGLPLILLALFLASLPMIQTQRRVPWNGTRHCC